MKSLVIGLIIFVIAGTMAVFGQTQEKIIKGGILNGKATSLPKPVYPDEARIAKVGGAVAIDIIIDEGGNVISAKRRAKTVQGEPTEADRLRSLLEDAAEAAALQARFSPTMLSGTPVKVSGQIVYNFVPGDGKDEATGPINGGILNKKAVNLPAPAYPPAARAVKAEGTVAVAVTIDENGDVISARAASGHPLLQAAAVEAARAAKFVPTRLSGQPVKVSGVITYNFVADKPEN